MVDLSKTLLRIEQVAHALRVTTDAVAAPGVRGRLDAWVGASSRRIGGARLHKAAKVTVAASDAAPLVCAAVAAGEATRAADPRPAVYAAVAVGVPALAPILVERFGGPALPAAVRRSLTGGASLAAMGRMGASGAGVAAAAAVATGVARVHLGADPTAVASGMAAGWMWARVSAFAFSRLGRHHDVPPPVEIDDYRERRSSAQ